MGAATALYSATCFAGGKYGNGNPYPANLSVVVGLSGWLPCAKCDSDQHFLSVSNHLQFPSKKLYDDLSRLISGP